MSMAAERTNEVVKSREKTARATLGNRQYPPLAEAPGTYVVE